MNRSYLYIAFKNYKHPLLHILILCCLNTIVVAQEKKFSPQQIDSLEYLLKESKRDSVIVGVYIQLIDYYSFRDNKKAIKYSDEAAQYTASLSTPLQIDFLVSIARLNMNEARYILAFEYLNRARRLCKNQPKQQKVKVYTALSDCYFAQLMADKALLYLYEALKLLDKKAYEARAQIFHNIGKVYYFRIQNYEKALIYYEKALHIYLKNCENLSVGLTGIYSDIGNVYYRYEDYERALRFYKKALRISIKNKNIHGQGYCLDNIGLVYRAKGEMARAIQYFEEALARRRQLNFPDGITNSLNHLAQAHIQTGNYKKAFQYIEENLVEAKRIGNHIYLIDAYQTFLAFYKAQRNFRKAIAYQDSVLLQNRLLIDEKRDIHLMELEMVHHVEEKEQENKQLKEENYFKSKVIDEQSKITTLLIIMTLFVAFVAYSSYRNGKKLKKVNKDLLQKNVEVEQSNEFKSKLFSIISHDFRSPLVNLSAFLDLFQEGYINEQEQEELLKAVKNNNQRALLLIENLLLWSRKQMNEKELAKKYFNLHNLVEEVIDQFQTGLEQKQLRLHNQILTQLETFGEQETIRVVLSNLLSNAIKFSHPKGVIKLSAQLLVDEVILSVKDEGIGIDETTIRKVFNRERVTSVGTTGEKGSGLSLTFCKDFLQDNNGKIWIESEVGVGTTVYFSLPLVSLGRVA